MHYSDDGSAVAAAAAAARGIVELPFTDAICSPGRLPRDRLNCGLNERFGRGNPWRGVRESVPRRFASSPFLLPMRRASATRDSIRQSSQSFRREQEPDLSRETRA